MDTPDPPSPHVGERIRALRRAAGLTLKELSAAAGPSAALLSQVERRITEPSLETLRRVARALDVPLFSLFQHDEPARVAVVRAGRRVLVRSPRGGITYSRLSPGTGRVEMLEGRLEPGGASSPEPWTHPSEECLVVTAGRLVVEVGGERHRLATGDSCYFDSRLPHRYVNDGAEPATFLLAASPPSY